MRYYNICVYCAIRIKRNELKRTFFFKQRSAQMFKFMQINNV